MATRKLTKRVIDTLPAATKRGGERYFDSALPGFGVTVYPSGRKSYFIYYGPSNRRRWMTLGTHGKMTPAEARELAGQHLAAVERGIDPKSGHPQVVPLSREAVALLQDAPRVDDSPWIVPGRSPEKPRADLNGPWKKIRAQAEIPDVHIHDIRRTFGLAIARTAGLHVASKLLRHSTVTVTEQVYAPLGLGT